MTPGRDGCSGELALLEDEWLEPTLEQVGGRGETDRSGPDDDDGQGDATRLRLLALVSAGEDGTACVCDLTGPVGLSQPTVSHHLKILVDAGLLERERRGTWSYYSVVEARLDALGRQLLTATSRPTAVPSGP